MQRRTSLISDLGRILSHFNIQELKDNVIPEFKNQSWKKVKEKLVAEKLQMSAKSVKMILMSSLTTMGNEDLTRKLYDIMLMDIACHSMRKVWVACKVKGNPGRQIQLKSIERNLTQACRQNNLECILRVLPCDNVVWFMIIEKKLVRNRGIILQKPVYGAYYWGEKYFFLSSNPNSLMVKVVAQAFAYNSGSILELRGHCVESLFRMLKNKESQASSVATFLETPYTPDSPKVTTGGIDYTGLPKRKQYTKDFFGDDPPVISELLVKDSEQRWQGTKTVPQMENAKVESGIVFKSKNVLQMLQEMVHIGAINLPLPPYIEKITSQAQTTVNT